MTQTMEPSGTPVFSRPPIGEIGIGVFFHRPSFLTSAHLGRFWERVAADFPDTEDHGPIGNLQEWQVADGLPLPRLWFIQANGNALLQLQVNRFHLNWRRRKDDDVYPNFTEHLSRFMTYWQSFCRYVREHSDAPLTLRGAEILKISHINEGQGWHGFSTVQQVFPLLATSILSEQWQPNHVFGGFAFERSEGRARIELKSAALRNQPDRRLLVLEIRSEVGGLEELSNPADLAAKLTTANELANLAFTSFTSPEVQRDVWGRTR